MNKIDSLFIRKNKFFASFLMAGHPTPDISLQALQALVSDGVDIVEIGFPFSDPAADGEIIQHSGEVALQNGIT